MIDRQLLLKNETYWSETIKNRLYNDLHEYIEKNKITQNEIAERLGISKSRVSHIFSGSNLNLTLETLVKLCLAIDKVPYLQLIDSEVYASKQVEQINQSLQMTSAYEHANSPLPIVRKEGENEFLLSHEPKIVIMKACNYKDFIKFKSAKLNVK